MAYFAELNKNNIVLRVVRIDDSIVKNENDEYVEELGVNYLKELYGQNTIWRRTCYNTRGGIYYNIGVKGPAQDQSKAFRKNFAQVAYRYDEKKDAFVNELPVVPEGDEKYVSFDEFACLWKYEPAILRIGVSRV